MVGIVGGEFADVTVELLYRENIEAGIDLANLFLRGAGGFLFDNRQHFRAAEFFPQHAAIAGGIFQVSAEQRHGGLLIKMKIQQARNRLRGNQRSISRKHDHMVVICEGFASHHQSMASTALLGLQNIVDAGVRHRRTHPVSLVADDGVNVLGRDYAYCGSDDVLQQRLSAHFM